MVQFYPCCLARIRKGDFPLNHDCILKVIFCATEFTRFAFYTCRAQDSGVIVDILTKLPMVSGVSISSVDSFEL